MLARAPASPCTARFLRARFLVALRAALETRSALEVLASGAGGLVRPPIEGGQTAGARGSLRIVRSAVAASQLPLRHDLRDPRAHALRHKRHWRLRSQAQPLVPGFE